MVALALALLLSGAVNPATANPRFATVAVDATTGKILFSRHADARRYPASLTKIMTLFVLFEELEAGRLTLQSKINISPHAASMQPSKIGLRAGSTISVENAIKALVTKSANDIAVAVAEAVSGTESAFARRMTSTAKRLGMTRTQFRNASGLPDGNQYTTARDMATLGLRIQREFPQYYHYFSTRSFTFRGRTYRNHNRLLGRVAGTDGIKTGYIRASGYNLTASVRRNGRHLVAVVMGGRSGRSRNAYMTSLINRVIKQMPRTSGQSVARVAGSPPGWVQVAEIRDSYPLPLEKPGTATAPAATDAPQVAEAQPEAETTIADLSAAAVEPVEVPPAPAEASGNAADIIPGQETTQTADLTTGAPHVLSPDDVSVVAAGQSVSFAPTDLPDHEPNSWTIQIGAFSSENDARQRLMTAQQFGLAQLDDKSAFTVAHFIDNRVVYRARFGGFDENAAQTTCKLLIRKAINCFPLAPEG